MKIRSMELRNYRNYEALSLSLDEDINVFLGQNAQGKTNVLEAVYYSALARSHRTSVDGELIRWEEPKGFLSLVFERIGVENTLEFHFERGKRRRIMYNGQPIRTKELIGAINVVLFSPEDLNMIKEGPGIRRRFIDTELSQIDKVYLYNLTNFNKVLKQRNDLLKQISSNSELEDTLDIWDEQLAKYGSIIMKLRGEYIEKISSFSNLIHSGITNGKENISIEYEPCISYDNPVDNLEVILYERIKESRNKDKERRITSIGPHRDDISFIVNGVDMRYFGSQGQQRTAALSLKLAELSLIKEDTGEDAILILDDVMSELDRSRQEYLIKTLMKNQLFITTTDLDKSVLGSIPEASIYSVESGSVKKVRL